jgi:polyphosphate:AMP phosphotransferase
VNQLFSLSVASPMTKAQYRKQSAALRQALMDAQTDLRASSSNAVLIVSGVDGGGKGETVQLLNEWMDPRWIRTHAFDEPSNEEGERPDFWRYWRRLPPRGEMALFLSAWYSTVLLERVNGASDAWLAAALDRIRRFEQMLSDDGMLIFKLWLHLDAEAQQQRFHELEADPLKSWRVTPRDWENWSRYDEFSAAAEEIIEGTDTDQCRWFVVDGRDDRRRAVEVGNALVAALRAHAVSHGNAVRTDDVQSEEERPAVDVKLYESVSAVSKAKYREELAHLQAELNMLYRRAREEGVPLIALFEGRDAAGKGGAIRRIVSAIDARRVDVARIGPPSEEELKHHYLWRFWRRLPRAGRVTLFDRSWYGRVLVERVEHLATEPEWRRAYDEINEFEKQLVEDGCVLVKFWLEIDSDEQKRRFSERSRVPHKRWKLTESDRRNRRLWNEYDVAVKEMMERTSTDAVPWTIVQANDKRHARLEVLRTLVDAMESHLSLRSDRRDRKTQAG